MYSVNSNLAMSEFSVVQPSTSQAQYKQGEIIRFHLPRNLGFVSPAESYLECAVQVSGNNYPMMFSNDCGANMMIEFVKISCNGVAIEEIDNYNVLSQLVKCYGESFNERQRKSPKDLSRVSNSSQQNTFKASHTNPTYATRLGGVGDTATNFQKETKVYIDLNLCGLFKLKSLIPLAGFPSDIEVEIRLAPSARVLAVDGNVKHQHPIVGRVENAGTSFVLDKSYKGFLNLGSSPFAVGMEVQLHDDGGAARSTADITSMQESQDGTITITCSGGFATGNTGGLTENNFITITKGTTLAGGAQTAAVDQATYTVNKANMYLAVVRPPQGYMNSMMKSMKSGMNLDLSTYTTYKNQIKKELPSQTLELPIYNTRAKGVLVVLNEMGQTVSQRVDNTQDYSANGDHDSLETYQFQDGEGKRFPTRPVDISSLNAEYPHPPAQHNHELSKTLMACGIPYASFRRLYENFVIGRAFGRYGATSNLSQQGGLRVYLDYSDSTKPVKDYQSLAYSCHINRVVLSENGLQVFT